MKIAILITGDEILKGDLRDSNSHYLIQQFDNIGLRVGKVVTLGDDLQLLAKEIKNLSENFDLLFINGGLGATIDDYTSEALSLAFQSPLKENQQAKKMLTEALEKRGREVTETEKKQVVFPEIAKPIFNKEGIAPGIFLEQNHCKIFCTPGVPSELYTMFEKEILPEITTKSYIETSFVRCFGIGESSLQQKISASSLDFEKQKLKLGFRAYFPYVDIKITSFDAQKKEILKQNHLQLQTLLAEHSFTTQNTTLEQELVHLLRQKGQKLTFAESCTGGLLTSKITSVSGASDVFQSGFILYQNEQKLSFGVSKQALDYGAVSKGVVTEMLICSLAKAKANIGAAVSGVAGPLGGSPEKPVGTVWVAWGTNKKINTKCFFIPRKRKEFQVLTSYLILDLLRRELLSLPYLDYYSFEKENETKSFY